jgi:hypothetical protein
METTMKAVLKNGAVCPQEPFPEDWPEGTELEVVKAPPSAADDDLDRWYAELDAACAQMDPEDDRTLKQAIFEVRRQEKELARKQAALEE